MLCHLLLLNLTLILSIVPVWDLGKHHEEALLSFSISKLRNKAYDMFCLDAWYLTFETPLKFGPKIVYQDKHNFKGAMSS